MVESGLRGFSLAERLRIFDKRKVLGDERISRGIIWVCINYGLRLADACCDFFF